MEHSGRKLARCAVAAAIAALAVAAPVSANERAELEVGFTTARPGASTGLTLAVEYKNPSDPSAKPPPLASAAFELPSGTRIDNAALPQCTATDAEIHARGRNACPPETKIGEGRLVAHTGTPIDPFDGEGVFFNGAGEIIEIVVVRGTDEAAGFDRIGIEGSTLRAHPPALPGGPPDGRTSIKRVELTAPARVEGGRVYVTTPPDCPADGLWRAAGRFSFDDGGSTTVFDSLSCERPAAPRLKLRVSPRTVAAGGRATLRVRVSSATPGCAAGASVRLGRARATTDSAGRAVLRKKLSKPAAVTVRVAKPGCGRATARVTVR
jgi:hypothetical protein